MAILMALALLMGALSAAPAIADEHGDGGVYLALGDSVPAGFAPGAPITDNGYPNILFDKLEKKYGLDELINVSCPGDDTLEMLAEDPNLSPPSDGSFCYGPATPFASQLDYAEFLVSTHPGEIKLITLTIGANDIFRCSTQEQANNPLCPLFVYADLLGDDDPFDSANLTPTKDGDLGMVIQRLQAMAPGVPIVAMNYYQPELAEWITDPDSLNGNIEAAAVGNSLLESVYGLFDGVYVADVQEAFKTDKTSGKVPKNVREICKLTLMCEKVKGDYVLSDWVPDNDPPLGEDDPTLGPQPDIHPSAKGHKKIAKTFEKLIKKHKLVAKHKK